LYGGGRSINNTNFGICYIFHNFLKTIQKLGNTYIKSSIALRNFKMHLKAKYDNLSVMDREINVDYSPAVLSYLYNNKLEPKKDILSTILNLYNKKVMTIEKDENGYNFIPMNPDGTDRWSLPEYNYMMNLLGTDAERIIKETLANNLISKDQTVSITALSELRKEKGMKIEDSELQTAYNKYINSLYNYYMTNTTSTN